MTGLTLGPVGLRVRRRAVVASLALLLVVVGLGALGLLTGPLGLPVDRVLDALVGSGSPLDQLVVTQRTDRLLGALLVGAALGAAGALTQSITRNPVASPDVLGVTAGASAFAVAASVRPDDVQALLGLPAQSAAVVGTLVGGIVTAAVVLLLAHRGGFDGYRLVLVGLAVNALALAVVAWLLTRAESEDAAVATRWLVGSLDGVDHGLLLPFGLLVGVCLVTCLVLADRLGAMRLGPDVASTLGATSGATVPAALAVSVLLAAGATAVAGPISLVAFAAPQVALRLLGTAGPTPLAGALTGAALLLAADTAAQALPVALPVGIVTSVLGAPFLLFLVARSLRRTRG
ncbi:iron chelate uptake ABC transporter family permease subunit [Luteimicrobium xylanilyticum]|uniref:Putative heme-iron transport system permease protein IsdF n=1 Tax=Luteimicrobium xylanilyticum TaxID=1133546 RepID=A0A5P9QAD4_9MICO|nr:iron chelate uptake ABC transporter family permease subunit [Luteimicrobium xylanilyticum]QFU98411.1 putative heme-iron transport system permease protein IsdF [Luteimicrobium xylanilyticum]